MLWWNLLAAWLGIFCGMAVGAAYGLRFHDSSWRGGYGSWERRLSRLGHISFFGLAFVNLAFVLTQNLHGTAIGAPLPVSGVLTSVLLIAGAVSMPVVCFLASWRARFRHWFFVPVGSLLAGVGTLIVSSLLQR